MHFSHNCWDPVRDSQEWNIFSKNEYNVDKIVHNDLSTIYFHIFDKKFYILILKNVTF